jgi:Recombination endonuclease VII
MVSKTRRQAVEHLYDMRAKFGLTIQQYTQLYNEDTECWVCGAKNSIILGKEVRLVIDHDHDKTGPDSIRGILCHHCNLAIGYAEDNPAMLRRMADYLERYDEEGSPLTGKTD